MPPVQLQQIERLWINVRLASADPDIAAPYGLREDCVLGVTAGRIVLIAPLAGLDLSAFGGELIDAGGALLTPGLIDSHTHLIYGGERCGEFARRKQGESYAEIAAGGGGILATVAATRALDEEELVAAARPRLEALLAEGVTTIEIKSGYGLTLNDELKMLRAARRLAAEYPVRLRTTLLAAHAVPPEFRDRADAWVDLICNELIPQVAAEELAQAVDAFCEPIAFSLEQCERVFLAARKAGLGLKIHAEQLGNSRGAELAARLGAWSADHLEYLDGAGVEALRAAGTVTCLLPGAFYFLGETRKPPVAQLRDAGVPLALASDLNPGSSPFASLRLMMNFACVLFGLTPEEAFFAATRHAAAALGLAGETGMLRVGMAADMLLWEIEDPAQLAVEFATVRPRQRIFSGEVSDV